MILRDAVPHPARGIIPLDPYTKKLRFFRKKYHSLAFIFFLAVDRSAENIVKCNLLG